jgi:hypothetical protein
MVFGRSRSRLGASFATLLSRILSVKVLFAERCSCSAIETSGVLHQVRRDRTMLAEIVCCVTGEIMLRCGDLRDWRKKKRSQPRRGVLVGGGVFAMAGLWII